MQWTTIASRGEMLVHILFYLFFFSFLLGQIRWVEIPQGMSGLEFALENQSGKQRGMNPKHMLLLGFSEHLFPKCPTAACKEVFFFFCLICSLGYSHRGAGCHFQPLLIAEDCHFQWTGIRFYWIFPERFNRIWGDHISICKTSYMALFTLGLFTAQFSCLW